MDKIKTMTFINEWTGSHGTMYTFEIETEAGVKGRANAKSMTPWYKAGDTVEVTQNGQDKQGNTKLSIKKPQDDMGGGYSNSPKTSSKGSYDPVGAKLGMCINNAITILLGQNKDITRNAIAEMAKNVLLASLDFEDNAREFLAKREKTEPVQGTPVETVATDKPKGGYGPDGKLAFDPNDGDENVPF